MNCLHCNTPNEEEAKFCKNCGMDLTFMPSKENTDSKSSDIFLIIFLGMALILIFINFGIDKLVADSYRGPFKYIRGFLWILSNLSYILIPLSVKDKSLKIIGFIIVAIIILYWAYHNIKFMMY